MLIVLDCPSCAKRYEVDATLAGKKSRCKQCGEIFRIPVPNAAVASQEASKAESRSERSSTDVGDRPRSVVVAQPARQSAFGTAASPSFSPSPAPTTTIVMNCPGCRKRYEVDGSLAGKKSRCKDCGEVFLIPVPRGRPSKPIPEQRPVPSSPPSPSPPARACASSPPAPAYWESVDEEEPTSFKPSRSPALPAYDEIALPPPPRAGYSQSEPMSRRPHDWGNNPDVGITIAGLYVAAAILVVIGFWIWIQAASPPAERIGQIFAITSLLLHGSALLLSFAGNIWLLVIAFKEKMEQGLLCLLVPCYAFYYIFSRWEDTKGAFVLELLPVGNLVLLFGIAYAVGIAHGRDAADSARERLAARNGAIAAGDDPAPAFGPPQVPELGPPRALAFGPPGTSSTPRVGRPQEKSWRFDPRGKIKGFVIQHGDQAVVLTFSGIPTNSDPALGVTTRDVSEAISARMRALVPNVTNFAWTRRNNRATLALSPIDDIAGLAQRIDFGTATVRDNQIDVVLSPEYVASVPRLAPEASVTAANPRMRGRSAELDIPPGADQVTRSLIQLKSPEFHAPRKEGRARLGRITPRRSPRRSRCRQLCPNGGTR